MIVYCIRHGESTYNAEGRIQGQSDVPLSQLGLRQSEAVAAALAGLPVEAIYSSPLERASQTAARVADALQQGQSWRPFNCLQIAFSEIVQQFGETTLVSE